jgi:hypothetical protein
MSGGWKTWKREFNKGLCEGRSWRGRRKGEEEGGRRMGGVKEYFGRGK